MGTVTFLFTDLVGSSRLWEEHPEAMKGALARHDVILRDPVKGHSGQVVKTTGGRAERVPQSSWLGGVRVLAPRPHRRRA